MLVVPAQAQDFTNPQQRQIVPDAYLQQFEGLTPSDAAVERMRATIEANRAAKADMTEAQRKLDGLLLAHAKQGAPPPATAKAGGTPTHPLLVLSEDGRVLVRIHASSPGAVRRGALRAAGADVTEVRDGVVSARVAPEALEAVAGVSGVQRVEPVMKGITNAGSVVTEGDALLGADEVRAVYGRRGQATKMCVISNGIGGAEVAAGTGDLPGTRRFRDGTRRPRVEVCPADELNVVDQGAEGTAMLEIVHDIAPLARLGFCPAFGPDGEAGLARSIQWLANDAFNGRGCDVIVDDVAYLTEPYFEDGPVAQAVDAAAEDGVLYFSSAGNSANNHYERTYVDVTPGGDAPGAPFVDLHDFGTAAGQAPDVDWLGVVAGANNFFAVFMQWTEPFGGAASDYDLYLFDQFGFPAGSPDGQFPIGGNGVAAQDGDDNPLEVAFVVNQFGSDPFDVILPFFIVVDRFDGRPDVLLEMNFNGFFGLDPVYNVAEGSVWGHAAAEGAVSVAAVDVATPDEIEPFSSRGPSRIFFPAFEERAKPDLTSFDGVSVTGAGGFPTTFFGTSAAAPHAAAVAGLFVKPKDDDEDEYGGGEHAATERGRHPPRGRRGKRADDEDDEESGDRIARRDVVLEALVQSAVDLGAPGFDFTYGAGRIDALAAAQLLFGDGDFDDEADKRLVAASASNSVFDLPAEARLRLAGANPFRSQTRLAVGLPEPARVQIVVHDMLGREVARLIDRDVAAGWHAVQWAPRGLASGVYFARMQTGDVVQTLRLVRVQ